MAKPHSICYLFTGSPGEISPRIEWFSFCDAFECTWHKTLFHLNIKRSIRCDRTHSVTFRNEVVERIIIGMRSLYQVHVSDRSCSEVAFNQSPGNCGLPRRGGLS